MKAKELKYYKPLDITQLSGSPWNDAEKVLGLDQDDKVIMAEPEETVTPEYVDEAIAEATENLPTKNWVVGHCDLAISAATADLASYEYVDDAINQAMEVETARTESTYLKQSDIDDDQFPTKNWVKGHTALAIEHSMEDETARTESTYAKKSEIPDMDDYYTKEQVDDLIDDIDVSDQLANYALTTAVTADIQTAIANETARTESTYAKPADIPSLDNYYNKSQVDEKVSGAESYADSIVEGLATETYVDDAIAAIPPVDLSGYAKTTAVTQDIQTAIAAETARTESTYLKQSDIDDDQYPTKNWVKGHTALAIEHSMEEETARTESTYAKIADIPSLDGYATEQYVDDAIADIPEVDLSGYAKTTAVTEDIQTAMAAETARTESTYLKEHQSLDNYYTKSQVDGAISAATQDLASTDYVDDAIAAIPPTDLSNYYTKGEVDAEITGATEGLASEDYVDNAVSGLASEDYVDNAVTSATQNLASESYVDAAVTAATQGLASEQYVDDAIAAIPETDLSDYYTKDEVDSEITGATEGLATENYVDTAIGNIPQPDMSDYVSKDELTGTTTPIVPMSELDFGWELNAYDSNWSELENGWFRLTSSDRYKVINLSTDTPYAGLTGIILNGFFPGNGYNYGVDVQTVMQNLSMDETFQLVTPNPWKYPVFTFPTSGDDVYLVLDVEQLTIVITQNLASIQTEVPGVLDNYYTTAQTYNKNEVDGLFAAETARTESTYLKEHQDISGKLDKTDFNTYTGATETALAEKLDASAYTVDNALSSASTNPVENRAVYDALYGTSATTELQVLDTDSTWKASIGNTLYPLKNTTIENLKAIYLGDIVPSGNNSTNIWLLDGSDSVYKLTPGQGLWGEGYVASGDVGNTIFWFGFESSVSTALVIQKSYLDDTYEYYLLLDVEKLGCVVYKTLPAGITEVSDHSANISDLPTAQDGSNFKQYVYNGGSNDYKRVVSDITFEPSFSGIRAGLKPTLTGWNNSGNKNGAVAYLPAGSEVAMGVKTAKDSVIIDRAEEALSGMTEQVTLTIGSTTTGSQYRIYVNSTAKNLYTTNDPRYYVYSLPLVSPVDNYWTLSQLRVGGTTYRIVNPYTVKSSSVKLGKYQIVSGSTNYGDLYVPSAVTKYAIVDVEMKTVEITDSLTITRAKNIPQAISAATQGMVTSGDVATQIDTAIASETARTESTYAKPSQIPSLTGYATEQWVENQGYLTQHQSLAEYYTKTEIDGMIGDIESLLASI